MLASRESWGQWWRWIDRLAYRGIQPEDAWIGWVLYILAFVIVLQTIRLVVRKEWGDQGDA